MTADADRWVLWLPALLGVGIGLYFALPAEPVLWVGPALVGVALLAARVERLFLLATALGTVALGFAVAEWRTALVAAPSLDERLGPAQVAGRVVLVESLEKGRRALLERLQVAGLGPERTPERVRLTLKGEQPDFSAGDWLRVKAVLAPPRAPNAPGAFDFQRMAYFMELGGVGYAVGKAEVVAPREAGRRGIDDFAEAMADLRHRITQRILATLEGPRGAIAAALMSGERGAIPEDLMDAIRDSGLAHLLSISGLHIGLVAGILFVGLRGLLALIPFIALRHPIKKWAAAAAIGGALFYSLLAGATVPTVRSFLMILLVLAGVLLDRRVLSMRLVAWAAAAILLFRPESLLEASFQMSFGAVVALIAAYEWLADRRRERPAETRPLAWRLVAYPAGILLTTLIATLATTPYGVYHFNRLALYGIAGNLIAIPATSFWIMPWAVLAFLLMPFGLEDWALVPLGWGVDLVIWGAETVAAWPGAAVVLPTMPVAALTAMTAGGLWLSLWRRPVRLWGLAGVAAGILLSLSGRLPDVLVDGQGKLLAVRTADGGLSVSSLAAGRFEREAWLQRAGLEDETPWDEAEEEEGGDRLRCDSLGCVLRTGGRSLALVRQPGALLEDCRMADAVISLVPIRRTCRGPQVVIDRFDLWREGAHALWVEGDGRIRVESVNGNRGNRPWVIRPRSRDKGL
ncbi:MAG: ComEC family competence protein [Magnetospirillum sp. WYHS-4]